MSEEARPGAGSPSIAAHGAAVGDDAGSNPEKKSSDLKPRLVAGVVMSAVSLALAYAGPRPFALLVIGVALVMCWEWGRVIRSEDFGPALFVHAGAVLVAGVLGAMGMPIFGVLALVIGVALLLAFPFGPRRMMSAAGVGYVGLPTVAMLWLRGDEPYGFLAVLFIFLVVWGSDIGAFAAGRGIGGPKLWPRVSPNKTWAGLLGGLTAGLVGGILFALFVPNASSFALGATGLALALVAQLGDLAESALKRRFGIKDSSSLIPGHGGVMDRADSTVAVSLAVSILALLVSPSSPARALLGV
ncbi:MAG: phosphatidate cytidylyltransferase [Hyphomicrobiaceae bacterium]|nr:phosphatidate cytidylyltransferase [Hyphomicrobiaceae bacterium]MCC0009991.1 phosphatidate cytidylyltransferase [Hyphomicrobiaceae bacterium]